MHLTKRSLLTGVLLVGIGIVFGVLLVTNFRGVDSGFAGSDVRLGADPSTLGSLGDTPLGEGRFIAVAKAVTPAVVSVRVTTRPQERPRGFEWFFHFEVPKPKPQEGSGSGVIVTTGGYILTNNHVVTDADRDKITVVLYDKRQLKARLIGTDPLTDLAVIKIDASGLPAAVLGNSDSLRVGQWVLAIGNPFNLYSTVTHGIVSALARGNLGVIGDNQGYGVEDFIQTDAAINPGNSGGALVNLRGEVIGINSAIATTTYGFQGYGFAIPINLAKSVAEELIRSGKVSRGYIGVQIQPVDGVMAKSLGLEKPQGVLVYRLVEGGSAKAAGLREGDVILKVDGKPVNEPNELQAYVSTKRPGDRVTVTVYRDGKRFDREVTLRARKGPDDTAQSSGEESGGVQPDRPGSNNASFSELGFGISLLSGSMRSSRSVNHGVLVTEVDPSGPAARRGLREGDIILEMDRQAVTSVADAERILIGKRSGSATMLRVKGTDNSTRLVFIEIP